MTVMTDILDQFKSRWEIVADGFSQNIPLMFTTLL